MKITHLGTTVLLFDDGVDQILFDAHFTRPSIPQMFLKKLRTDTSLVDKIIAQYKLDRLRGIFISHTHHDHVLDAPYLAAKTGAAIYGSVSAMNVARGGCLADQSQKTAPGDNQKSLIPKTVKIPEEKLFCYDDSMEYTIGDFHIRILPSIHSKAHWYNNDLGQVIDAPLTQPAAKKQYKEGGSYDFLITHKKSYLIRPSCNYIPGQLDGIHADVLYLGIGGLSGTDSAFKEAFFRETVEKTSPGLVIPIHWDNFFKPLYAPSYLFPPFLNNTEKSLFELAEYCGDHHIPCTVQLPLTEITM